MNFDQFSVTLIGDATLNYGKFITAVINFLIMAFVIFSIIKAINKMSEKMHKTEEEPETEATTKVCPFCKNEIPLDAVRCGFCTSVLDKALEKEMQEQEILE